MPNMHYVYHIKIDGMGVDQGYVGVTNRPQQRFDEHKKSRLNPYLKRAIKKYGNRVKFVILDSFPSRDDAHWLEYTLRPKKNIGWNIAVGGKTPPTWKGRNHSESTKQVMSKSAKGRVISPEQRKAISEKLKGIKFTPERLKTVNPNYGIDHHNSKPCNIYEYGTDRLVASNVAVTAWAKDNGVQQSALSLTAKADRSKPSSRSNRLHTKGYYARYL